MRCLQGITNQRGENNWIDGSDGDSEDGAVLSECEDAEDDPAGGRV